MSASLMCAGSELLLHGGARNGVADPGHHPPHHIVPPGPGLDPGPMPGSVMFNNVNSFYSPAHQSYTLFPPSYTVHHPATVRPVTRDTEMMPGHSSMRHPSGGSVTGGSAGSHTPPSPDTDRSGSFKQSGAERSSGVRNSFEQRQCNSVGSDQASGSPGGGPPFRLLQPPSPATQKSPFDMSTMGMNKSVGQTGAPSAFSSTGIRSSSVISSVRSSASPYNIKQEPGSPVSVAGVRGVKEVANRSSPQSPRNVNLSPTPAAGQNNGNSYSGASKLQNRVQTQTSGNGSNSGQGFTFPSPQPHNTHPISPAAEGVNNNNSSNNNNSRTNSNNSKFRYPSGPIPVQNMSPGDTSTSNSAMSSREGTPGPGGGRQWCNDNDTSGPAPNVDISHVTVKVEY